MQVITGSSDSTVRVWDAKTCDCIANFRPPQALVGGGERAVLDVHLNPQNVDHIIVCTRSSTLFIMTLQGQVQNTKGFFYRPKLTQEEHGWVKEIFVPEPNHV